MAEKNVYIDNRGFHFCYEED